MIGLMRLYWFFGRFVKHHEISLDVNTSKILYFSEPGQPNHQWPIALYVVPNQLYVIMAYLPDKLQFWIYKLQ